MDFTSILNKMIRKNNNGSAMIEFALCLPILYIIIIALEHIPKYIKIYSSTESITKSAVEIPLLVARNEQSSEHPATKSELREKAIKAAYHTILLIYKILLPNENFEIKTTWRFIKPRSDLDGTNVTFQQINLTYNGGDSVTEESQPEFDIKELFPEINGNNLEIHKNIIILDVKINVYGIFNVIASGFFNSERPQSITNRYIFTVSSQAVTSTKYFDDTLFD